LPEPSVLLPLTGLHGMSHDCAGPCKTAPPRDGAPIYHRKASHRGTKPERHQKISDWRWRTRTAPPGSECAGLFSPPRPALTPAPRFFFNVTGHPKATCPPYHPTQMPAVFCTQQPVPEHLTTKEIQQNQTIREASEVTPTLASSAPLCSVAYRNIYFNFEFDCIAVSCVETRNKPAY
jgi:hypothetical protein